MERALKRIKLEEEVQGNNGPSFLPIFSATDWDSPLSVIDPFWTFGPVLASEPLLLTAIDNLGDRFMEEKLFDFAAEEEELGRETLVGFIQRQEKVEKDGQAFIRITHTIDIPAPTDIEEFKFIQDKLHSLDKKIKDFRENFTKSPKKPPPETCTLTCYHDPSCHQTRRPI